MLIRYTINLIYDPYKTESTILDSSLKIFASSKSCIFPYAEICDFFIKKAETEKTKKFLFANLCITDITTNNNNATNIIFVTGEE